MIKLMGNLEGAVPFSMMPIHRQRLEEVRQLRARHTRDGYPIGMRHALYSGCDVQNEALPEIVYADPGSFSSRNA